jgi:membrane-associated phospholipid phosphatase
VRGLLLVYIAAMTFTLTYGGEHYVVDAVLGWAYAAFSVWVVSRVLQRRARAELPAR